MPRWSLREASADDAQWIAELRAVVLRADLERLGRFDPVRVRQRFLSAFDPAVTQVVVASASDRARRTNSVPDDVPEPSSVTASGRMPRRAPLI